MDKMTLTKEQIIALKKGWEDRRQHLLDEHDDRNNGTRVLECDVQIEICNLALAGLAAQEGEKVWTCDRSGSETAYVYTSAMAVHYRSEGWTVRPFRLMPVEIER